MASKPISNRRRYAFASLALVFALAPMTARAESIFDLFSSSVSPSDVQYNLARAGFVARSAMVRRGDVYLYDVSDRYGVPQRLIIDSHTGRIVERYSLRPSQLAEARRADVRPRALQDDTDENWDGSPRPQVDVTLPHPHVIEASPSDSPPTPPRIVRPFDFAYGGGHAPMPPVVMPLTDPKPAEKPRPRLARPKPIAQPTSGEQSQTATAAPTATDAVAPQASTPPVPAPTTSLVAPARPQPAVAEPSTPATPAMTTTGMLASSGAAATEPAPAAAKAPPAPQPALAPVIKSKAINDIPVAPLD